jgi:phosphatidylinositol glycan class T
MKSVRDADALSASSCLVILLPVQLQKLKGDYAEKIRSRRNAGMLFLALLIYLSLQFFICTASPDYHEKLLLQPLPPGSLLASFNFRSNASLSSFEQQHFSYLPRSLSQILQHSKTRELHLRFSTGRWDAESWGARPWGGAKEGGTGVELWAWVEADSEAEYAASRFKHQGSADGSIGPLRVGLH